MRTKPNRFKQAAEALLGRALVQQGLLTDESLKEALREQSVSREPLSLEQVLIRKGILGEEQLQAVAATTDKRFKLGEVLLRGGAITQEQLDNALAQQKTSKVPLGQLLVKLGYLTDDAMRQALSAQLNVPYIDLERMTIDPALAKLVNRTYARRRSLVPVSKLGNCLTVCMDDPTDRSVVDELKKTTNHAISVVTASRKAIEDTFARLYAEPVNPNAGVASGPMTVDGIEALLDDEGDKTKVTYGREFKQADVIVSRLLVLAISQNCSDIHIETLSSKLNVRFRIDGVLQEAKLGELQDACNKSPREIVSRLKILSKLDIAERRRPQDGSFRVRINRNGEQTTIDLRVSVVPSLYGESVVLRVLDRSKLPESLDKLGLPARVALEFGQVLQRPHGIILVTGPTGSGKSTTLYVALKSLSSPEIRVLTAEDPIEYVYEQFSQCEVNQVIGNTFATYLRAFLRHDPEVMMVGEIRDQETAEMAFRAAQTGHLLLSTLHTNTAVGAVTRLRDLGIDSNMIAGSLLGVLGQRLVRKVCQACKQGYNPTEEIEQEFFPSGRPVGFVHYKGSGCEECGFSGYRGRAPLVEWWMPNDEDIILISKGAQLDELRASAKKSMVSTAECAWGLLDNGRTNLEELIRVMPYSAIREVRMHTKPTSREPIAIAS